MTELNSKTKTRPSSIAAKIMLTSFSLVISLLAAEFGFRIFSGLPVLEMRDWRMERARMKRIGDRADLDPHLGWRLKPNFSIDEFTTLTHGVRRNFDENTIRTGGILAVGDSFTEGFGVVADDETWPAHLEALAGVPVVNGGVSGYAADQIILRAEMLMPVVKPKTLIVGFTEVDIDRVKWSDDGAPKPHFTLENDALVYHEPEVFEANENLQQPVIAVLRTTLGYSALADHLLSRLAYDFWYPRAHAGFGGDDYDPGVIACRLLGRLKKQTDQQNVKLVVFLQYGAYILLDGGQRPEDMAAIGQCADKLRIAVVDQLDPLKAITKTDPALVARYYADEGGEFGHMSSNGNEHAARILLDALKAPLKPSAISAPSVR